MEVRFWGIGLGMFGGVIVSERFDSRKIFIVKGGKYLR